MSDADAWRPRLRTYSGTLGHETNHSLVGGDNPLRAVLSVAAGGDVGDSTTLSFANLANIGLTDVNGGNLTFITPTGVDGLIQVVPEPVDYALGIFGMIVFATAGVRWVLSRRKPLRTLN